MSEIQVPTNYQYLRPQQVSELEGERRSLDRAINNPAIDADKGEMRKRKRRIENMLANQQAPDLSPQERDAYAREAKALEEQFAPEMLSAEVMRKNPPGSVDRNLRFHRKHAARIARWKNLMRVLHKGDTGPDVANIERLRPHRRPTDPSMQGAQIEGTSYDFPSEQFKANYEATFGTPPDAGKSRARSRPKSTTQAPVAMPCGEMKDPRGRRLHVKSCDGCKAVLAAEDTNAA